MNPFIPSLLAGFNGLSLLVIVVSVALVGLIAAGVRAKRGEQ